MSHTQYSKKPAFWSGYGTGNGRISRYRWHIFGIGVCAALFLFDIITTTIALSGSLNDGSAMFREANPLMAGIVNSVPMSMLLKLAVLSLVVAAVYILRDNGRMKYMPYVIVGTMYLVVVMHNVSLLLPIL